MCMCRLEACFMYVELAHMLNAGISQTTFCVLCLRVRHACTPMGLVFVCVYMWRLCGQLNVCSRVCACVTHSIRDYRCYISHFCRLPTNMRFFVMHARTKCFLLSASMYRTAIAGTHHIHMTCAGECVCVCTHVSHRDRTRCITHRNTAPSIRIARG